MWCVECTWVRRWQCFVFVRISSETCFKIEDPIQITLRKVWFFKIFSECVPMTVPPSAPLIKFLKSEKSYISSFTGTKNHVFLMILALCRLIWSALDDFWSKNGLGTPLWGPQFDDSGFKSTFFITMDWIRAVGRTNKDLNMIFGALESWEWVLFNHV